MTDETLMAELAETCVAWINAAGSRQEWEARLRRLAECDPESEAALPDVLRVVSVESLLAGGAAVTTDQIRRIVESGALRRRFAFHVLENTGLHESVR